MANWSAIGACILPNLGGWANGYVTARQIKTKDGSPSWYDSINKPSWRPPNWVFGPVWTSLYTSMGYASYLVYRDGGGFQGDARLPLLLFGSQLALNWAWSPIFFIQHNLKWSLYEIIALTANVAVCGAAFYKINSTAGLLFVPYLAWLSLATALTYCIHRDNPDGGAKIKELKD